MLKWVRKWKWRWLRRVNFPRENRSRRRRQRPRNGRWWNWWETWDWNGTRRGRGQTWRNSSNNRIAAAAVADLIATQAAASVKCTNGHVLQAYVTTGGSCDKCGVSVSGGGNVFDCRSCNYWLCTNCYQTQKANSKIIIKAHHPYTGWPPTRNNQNMSRTCFLHLSLICFVYADAAAASEQNIKTTVHKVGYDKTSIVTLDNVLSKDIYSSIRDSLRSRDDFVEGESPRC